LAGEVAEQERVLVLALARQLLVVEAEAEVWASARLQLAVAEVWARAQVQGEV
jgi:hypothetical protein